jgi:hypothetical protein
MTPLTALWLPILASAVLVFVASSIIHMVLPYHRSDYRRVPDEDRLMSDLRAASLQPGQYAVPHAGSPKEMGDPAFVERQRSGPNVLLTVLPAASGMGTALAAWFVFGVAVSVFAGYVAGRALGPGADYLDVFRFSGAAAFGVYGLGSWPGSIWYGRPWAATAKSTFDGLVYAALTAGVFGWLWS